MRHIPDYLLVRGADPTFEVVKPLSRLEDPKVVQTLEWVRDVVESGGWGFTWPASHRSHLDNVRFLAGYRRARAMCPRPL